MLEKYKKHQFLFEELVKRDFKKKYKRTVLGMGWSILSPLVTLLVMRLVFTHFFGRTMSHYTTYLFCGNLVFAYFSESTSQGMTSLLGNAAIFTKVNVPKYLFLLSKNCQTLINFGLTLVVFFIFCLLDHIVFTWKFAFLLYPVALLMLFNIGMGLVLSALYVFFRDIQYLWSIFSQLLMYMSAIFYSIDSFSPAAQRVFLLNPVYLFIRYFRSIVIDAAVPNAGFHLLMAFDVAVVVLFGCWMYRRYNTEFLYYV
ncbi:ABC transporter permease [Pyramidobacter sp. C12-8]|uniref:ABC transporter permease n=1 Tax=Pyramidobacter sp. C12-8 TaxID=1943580 RepID=UPI00098FC6F1|nr:ABC transporter permease [Pyramidobacter sp. C12-8]OON87267.1 ABC transporter [Pyramidobacter sp. C12-8]